MYLLQAGAFENVDAALMAHPTTENISVATSAALSKVRAYLSKTSPFISAVRAENLIHRCRTTVREKLYCRAKHPRESLHIPRY